MPSWMFQVGALFLGASVQWAAAETALRGGAGDDAARKLTPSAPNAPMAMCTDSPGSATNRNGTQCEWFNAFPLGCLFSRFFYDDSDFTATAICCACNGGEYPTPVPDPTPAPPPTPMSNCAASEVALQTLRWGNEISWEIIPFNSGSPGCSGSGYFSYHQYAEPCCLPTGWYVLKCEDSFGDGWHGASIEFAGANYCGNFSQGYSHLQVVQVLVPETTTTTLHSTTETSTSPHTTTETVALCADYVPPGQDMWFDSAYDDCSWYEYEEEHVPRCLVHGHVWRNFDMAANDACCVCGGGARAPTPEPSPTPASICFVSEVMLQTRLWGFEIAWQIVLRESTGTILCSGGHYEDHHQYTIPCCLPMGSFEVRCADSHGDGWHGASLTIDGMSFCDGFRHGHLAIENLTVESTTTTAHSTTETTTDTSTTSLHTTTETTPLCADHVPFGRENWYDGTTAGHDCEWYGTYDSELGSRCLVAGHVGRNFGMTANEACCACGGGVRVPTPAPAPTPASNCLVSEVALETRSFGNEIAWQIVTSDDTSDILCSGSHYESFDRFTIPCCIPEGSYQVWCGDSYGDGWHGASLTIGGASHCSDFVEGSLAVESFTLATTTTTLHSTTETSSETGTTSLHTTTETTPLCVDYVPAGEEKWYFSHHRDCSWYEQDWRCLVAGHARGYYFNMTANEACCACGGGVRLPALSPAPTPASNCAVSEVVLQTVVWGLEIAWQIVQSEDTSNRLCSGGNYEDHQNLTIPCCLPPGSYEVRCADSYGDGWHGASLTIDGISYCHDFSTGNLTNATTFAVHQ